MTRQLVSKLLQEIPELMSLLYDLDLLPEQVESGSKEEGKMFLISAHFHKMAPRMKS